jgi:hypothetical protein
MTTATRILVAYATEHGSTLEAADVESSRAQLERALRSAARVAPVAVAIFGGVVAPAKLRFPFSRMPATDARDWGAIDAWATGVAGRFAGVVDGAETQNQRASTDRSRARAGIMDPMTSSPSPAPSPAHRAGALS